MYHLPLHIDENVFTSAAAQNLHIHPVHISPPKQQQHDQISLNSRLYIRDVAHVDLPSRPNGDAGST
jgi:hypothetical protein